MKFKDKVEAINRELVCLKHVKNIVETDSVFPEWVYLKEQYEENQDSSWVTKALITITNSVLTQRRVFFCMRMEDFRTIARNDLNWRKSIGLDNSAWKDLLLTGYKAGLFREVKRVQVRGRTRIVFELTDPETLSLIVIDKDKQRVEALSFIEDVKTSDESEKAEATPEPDTVIERDIAVKPAKTAPALNNVTEFKKPAQPNVAIQAASVSTATPQVPPPPLALPEVERMKQRVEALYMTKRLDDWERDFVMGLPSKLQQFGYLTPKQKSTLEKLEKEFLAPQKTPAHVVAVDSEKEAHMAKWRAFEATLTDANYEKHPQLKAEWKAKHPWKPEWSVIAASGKAV